MWEEVLGMIKITNWDVEVTKEFNTKEGARAYMIGQLVIKYMYRLSEESTSSLANRLGFEINVEEIKEDTKRQ